MDKEWQIRLNFLDEAEEYFDKMESNLLGVGDSEVDAKRIDVVLRSAHSVKGGAAMMGFLPLSHTAHRLEDFLKILRVRYSGERIEVEVETLLLQGVDALRGIANENRQAQTLAENSLESQTQAIFESLQSRLGTLEESDEDALMAQNEEANPALLLFEDGVQSSITDFEEAQQSTPTENLAALLSATAEELVAFGNMAELPAFCQLCESISTLAEQVPSDSIETLANKALKAWKRSHSLVMRGSLEKLPTSIEGFDIPAQPEPTIDHFEIAPLDLDLELDSEDTAPLDSAFGELRPDEAVPQIDSFDIADIDTASFGALLSEVDDLDSFAPQTTSDPEVEISDPLDTETTQSTLLDLEDLDLDILQNAIAEVEFDPSPMATDDVIQELSRAETDDVAEAETSAGSQPVLPDATQALLEQISQRLKIDPTILYELINQKGANKLLSPSTPSASTSNVDQMVRIPASQLKQFNSLFEQLILNRNTINLKLQQFQETIRLMGQRIAQIEDSNIQLKQWYDRASLEGFLNYSNDSQTGQRSLSQDRGNFDSLEMDRYSDIHLICQSQIETIVQLQEVATDVQLGLSDISQSVDALNYTTQSMQGNVTRTQMIPFKEVIKRCPRMIRDLNLQYDKQVTLEILGDGTLLDRQVAEVLNDPLLHLLRNAFDHGIEEAEVRVQRGKKPGGKITLQARNQGTSTVITIQDDGAGLSLDKIRDRIVQMGIPREDVVKLPEADLLEFIFEPGFSTADKVTELSGRGVGMDVVKTNLEEIQGSIQVSSQPGQGTTFSIRIPYTLSILRVAVVEQDGMIFAIPAHSIEEMFDFDSRTVQMENGIPSLSWSDQALPVIELEKALIFNRTSHKMRLQGSPTIDQSMVIVIKNDHRHAALKVNRFWYEQESTIRPIDSLFPLPTGMISSVVFGDGRVIPLIDPSAIIDPYLEVVSDPTHADTEVAQVEESSQRRILIVDDSINVRRFLAHTLEKAGYTVDQARDGQEAVDLLTEGLSVNAVICDIEMPRLDGYGFLEEVKGQAQFEALPVLMLTSRSNEKHRRIAMNLGATDYFSKPFNEVELMTRLADLTESSERVAIASY